MEKERNRNLMGAASRNTCRIERAGTVKESTCRQWFTKFPNGRAHLLLLRN
jgi:hypothetical protein